LHGWPFDEAESDWVHIKGSQEKEFWLKENKMRYLVKKGLEESVRTLPFAREALPERLMENEPVEGLKENEPLGLRQSEGLLGVNQVESAEGSVGTAISAPKDDRNAAGEEDTALGSCGLRSVGLVFAGA